MSIGISHIRPTLLDRNILKISIENEVFRGFAVITSDAYRG